MLSFAELIAPSVKLAREGFRVYPSFAGSLRVRAPLFKSSPEWNKVFTKDGTLLKSGDLLIQSDLADTLSHYGDEGSTYLFKGQFAKDLVSSIRQYGGGLTLEDLERYKISWNPYIELSSIGTRATGLAAFLGFITAKF